MNLGDIIKQMERLEGNDDPEYVVGEAALLLYDALDGLLAGDTLQGELRQKVHELLEAFDDTAGEII
jgi:hypothetical protein